jgi:SPP1 gp7 family putative phage head morphogenesis protein
VAVNDRARATVETIAAHRRYGLAKRRRPIPRQRYPKLIEFEYANAIIGIVRQARPALQPLLDRLPALLESAQRARKDDQTSIGSDEGEQVRLLMELAERHMRQAVQPVDVQRLAAQFADRTQRQQRDQFQRQVKAGLGVDIMSADRTLPALVSHFVAENVTLIRAVPEEIMAGVGKLVTQAFSSGTRHEDLASQIQQRFNVGESRARLIARDQIGKLNGQVNAARQKAIGITSFVWRTVGDERVRPEHEDRDGETYSYDDPPDGELPGEPIQCRCSAEPVFDDILDPDPEIPETQADVTNETKVHEVDAQQLEERGYYEPEAGFDGGQRLENARKAIREGQREAVRMTIGPDNTLQVTNGRHRLRAAIELGAKVKVRYAHGIAPPGPGMVKRGGKLGG